MRTLVLDFHHGGSCSYKRERKKKKKSVTSIVEKEGGKPLDIWGIENK